MKSKRDSKLLWALAALVTLFALGWWFSVTNEARLERDALLSSQKQRLEIARAVVREGLESLRAREDQRPFYHYNPLYSPPDVIAFTDPLVVSPLASADDPRIIAHFQIDPGGEVRTPYDLDDTPSERTLDVRKRMRHPDFALLRGLASPKPKLRAPRTEPIRPSQKVARRQQSGQKDAPTPASNSNYTVSLNEWSKALYSDIQNNAEPTQKSRNAPMITRKTVSEKPSSLSRKKVQTQRQSALANTKTVRKKRNFLSKFRPPAKKKPALKQDLKTTRVLLEQNRKLPKGPSATVLYTRISFARLGPELVLYRAVTHEGLTSVQGVILDEDALKNIWIPKILLRHSAEAIPLVEGKIQSAQCLLSAPVNDLFLDLRFCFPTSSFREPSVLYQKTALFLLLTLAAFLLFAIHLTQRRAKALTQRRSDFIASVSHELRTPLTTLRMNAEMLRDKLVAPKNEHKFLNTMVGESVRLSNLVENVLEIARFDQGSRPLHKSDLAIDDLFDSVEESQGAYCEGRNVHLDVLKSGLILRADQKSLEQILINLVENAAKYGAPDSGRHVVQLAAKEEGDAYILSVSDTGPGIPKALRRRVFERFVRAREEGDTVVGTGIGLSLVKDLALAHGGDAYITDTDVGTKVCVRLPKA